MGLFLSNETNKSFTHANLVKNVVKCGIVSIDYSITNTINPDYVKFQLTKYNRIANSIH